MSKPLDDYICPFCGKKTVVPVVNSGGEILAIHAIVYGVTKWQKAPCERIAVWCTEKGRESRLVEPCDRILPDKAKHNFPDAPINQWRKDKKLKKLFADNSP